MKQYMLQLNGGRKVQFVGELLASLENHESPITIRHELYLSDTHKYVLYSILTFGPGDNEYDITRISAQDLSIGGEHAELGYMAGLIKPDRLDDIIG